MKQHRIVSWMIAFSLIVTSMTGSAQTPYDSEPIFLWVRGDLWQWNPVDLASAPVQVTTDGTISAPILSPDGAFIAYKAASPVGLDALSRIQTDGLIADFDLPADIALFAVADSTIVPITRQPADASLLVEGVADNALIRSSPVWLPDSLTLAYVEFAFGTTSAHLVIYDLASTDQPARTPLDASLPITGYPPQIAAGRGGIMLWQTGTGGETLFNFYGADGSFVARQFVPPSESSIETAVWVEQGDQSFPALLYTSGVWALFDQRSAAPIVTDLLPQLVARRLPAISYAVAFGRLDDSGFFWEAFDPMTPDAASVAFPGTPSRVTLSPSGRAIAFLGFPEFGAAAVYRDGELIAIPGTGSGVDALNVGALLWGETMWRVE